MSDEAKAGLVTSFWIVLLWIGLSKGDDPGLILVIISTLAFVSLMYIDMLNERAKAERRNRRRSNAVSRNFYREMAKLERSVENDNR
ncbi:MAG: hypothetical protein ACI4JW_08740 [Oscillospiraceae bacterium]